MGLKIKVDTGRLADALAVAIGVRERGISQAIFSHCLIVAGLGGEVSVSATSIDISVSVDIEAEVVKPGSALLETDRLLKAVRALPSGQVTIDVDDAARAQISMGRIRSTHGGANPSEFPDLTMGYPDALVIPGGALIELLKTVQHAASDGVRIDAEGVYLHAEDRTIKAVATDSHRLALASLSPSEGDGSAWEDVERDLGPGHLVPTKVVELLARVLDAGDVHLQVRPKSVVVHQHDMTLSYLVPERRFLNYRTAISGERGAWFEVDRIALVQALRRCELHGETKGAARVIVETSGEEVELSAFDATASMEHREPIACSVHTEQAFQLGSRYLRDVLSVCTSDRVVLGTVGDMDVPPIYLLDGDRTDRFFIIMPMVL